MENLNLAYALIGLAAAILAAIGFFKAGKFKATSPKDVLLAAGFGWVEKTPWGVVRLIAWLEILGSVALVASPVIAYLVPTLGVFQWLGVLSGAGLALLMVGAFLLHLVRGEAKYTWKMNLQLFLFASIASASQGLVQLPLF